MTNILDQSRAAVRTLTGNWPITAVVLLTLALGIGATTTIFAVVHSYLLRPLPYPSPERLHSVWQTDLRRGYATAGLSAGNYHDLREQSRSFEALGCYRDRTFAIGEEDSAAKIDAVAVTPSLLALLGVEPLIGRAFVKEEGGVPPREVLLSWPLWRERFGARRDVVGSTVRLNMETYTVAGVMPPSFQFPSRSVRAWVPMVVDPSDTSRGPGPLSVVGRLRDAHGRPQAEAELAAVAYRLRQSFPKENDGLGLRVVSLRETLSEQYETVRRSVLILFGAVGFVLLIACGNVASLLLAWTLGRRKEIAIRLALGASRVRVVTQLLTESAFLALGGGLLGFLIAAVAVSLLERAPAFLVYLGEVELSPAVVAFTAIASVGTVLLFGLVPALHGSRVDLNELLKQEEGRGSAGPFAGRLRGALVTAQLALAMVLLTGAGLMVRTLINMREVDPGFEPRALLTFETSLNPKTYASKDTVLGYYGELLDRLRPLPGVKSVAVVTGLPMRWIPLAGFRPENGTAADQNGHVDSAVYRAISPDYFNAMGIPLRSGRAFTREDGTQGSSVVIVNEVLERRTWPGESALGKRLRIDRKGTESGRYLTVVGVVAGVRSFGLNEEPGPELYAPYQAMPHPELTVVIRSIGDPLTLAPTVQRVALGIDPTEPVSRLATMEQVLDDWMSGWKLFSALLSGFAAIALVLAVVGLYGLVEYLVRRRSQELAIRVALGARTATILWLVVGDALRLALVGIGLGVLLAILMARVLQGLIAGIGPHDPATLLSLGALLSLVAIGAACPAAWRAARSDPMAVLRKG